MNVVSASLALALAAFAAIAMSMARHQPQIAGRALAPRAGMRWRAAGFALLALSLAPCLGRWNPSVAIAAWLGVLTFAAMALGLLFTYAPNVVRRLAPAAAALGLLAWLMGP